MSQGAEVLRTGANTDSAQTVYYAEKPWRVIAYGTEGNIAGEAGALTLFSADNLTTSQFNPGSIPNDCNNYGTNPNNTSSSSILKTTVDSLFNEIGTALFSDKEQAAVVQRTLEKDEYSSTWPYSTGVSGSETSGHLWPLSTAEALSLPDTFRAANNNWWLRSPGSLDLSAAFVNAVGSGFVDDDGGPVFGVLGVRPAFYLNLNSVLFTSAAVGGKSPGGLGTLSKVETMGTVSSAPNEWKLTLKDDDTISGLNGHAGFTASRTDSGDVQPGDTITITYGGAKTGGDEYVSVILKDTSGNILYYGNLANNSASGTDVALTIPAAVAPGEYTLGVFAEQCNGNNNTDYASEVKNIPIKVTAPPTPTPTPTPTPAPAPTPTPSGGSESSAPSVWYWFSSGHGQTWAKGSAVPVLFTVQRNVEDNKTFSLFGSVEIDGVRLDATQYSATAGSVNLSVSAEYLETLSEGTHTIRAFFTDGFAEGRFVVLAAPAPVPASAAPANMTRVTPPQTADTNVLLLTISGVMLLLALAGLCAVVWRGKQIR